MIWKRKNRDTQRTLGFPRWFNGKRISLPMQEMGIQSLSQEDPLEKEMATHSSILAWRIPWTEEPGSPWGCRQSDTTEQRTLLLVENSKELPQKIKNRITV